MANKKYEQVNSKLIRVDKVFLDKLEKYKGLKGSWNSAVENILNETSAQSLWVLPSLTYSSKEKALGASLKMAVAQRLGLDEREHPIKVKKVK